MTLFQRVFSSAMVFLTPFVWTQTAAADEVRVGVMAHDVRLIVRRDTKEESTALTAEYIFDTPGWLEWAASANPYVYGSANLEGHTNHGGVGLNWRTKLFGNVYGEFGTGLTVHDGTNSFSGMFLVPAGASPAELAALRVQFDERLATEIEFGSTVLFRNQLTIGYELSDKWAAELAVEHLSHGQILGGPENGGLDSVGLRLSRRF